MDSFESLKALKVTIDEQKKIAHVQLNQPEKSNALTKELWTELPTVLHKIDAEMLARVVVLSSIGKHFCAGMDFSYFAGTANTSGEEKPKVDSARRNESSRRFVLQLQEILRSLERIRVPVLTAIQGGCIGGGVQLVSTADCRYATADAYFCVKETLLGLTADVGTLQYLPKLLPQGLVRELAYTGRKMSAKEAKEVGFLNEVYETQEEMLTAVLDLADQIAQQSPVAVVGCKEVINYSRDHSLDDALNYVATWQAAMYGYADVKEAVTASFEKRVGEFDELEKMTPPFS